MPRMNQFPKDFLKSNPICSSFGLLFLVFLTICLMYACEKDDICVDGDTPLLILRFYNASDTTALKAVTKLRIVGLENGAPINTFSDRTSSDSVAIPLRINESNTVFKIIFNSDGEDDVETGNIDTLLFNYDTQEVFVSRACGFVANYENLSDALTSDTDNWIQDIEIINPSITSQESAHVKILH